jgi:ABC-2 type transport system ATP-binding protein
VATKASASAVMVTGLRRTYETGKGTVKTALDQLDLQIEVGEIHGLLGPNGAGKTTLCKILSTVLLPSAGYAEILGLDVVACAREVRSIIGIVFGGERGLYTRLTARDNLLYWSALQRRRRSEGKVLADALLERVGLADQADHKVETFSRGMKQRLHLARGLIGDPRVLILDEPTTGMDPVAAREFRVLVRQLQAEGRTLLITTHDMAEAEAVCNRVSLIDAGKLLGTEDPRTIGQWMRGSERVIASGVQDETIGELAVLSGVTAVRHENEGVVIETADRSTVTAVLSLLVGAGVTGVSTRRPSLEDVYLQVIGDRKLAIR